MNDPGRVAIIGAGPTGLGAAHRLRELGCRDVAIFEATAHPGGLASSHLDAHGFTWDVGGHVQFSHYACYDDVLDSLGLEWLHHQRESWIRMRGRFIPYPLQNNIHRFDAEERDRALAGLEEAARRRPFAARPENFRDWIFWTFGEGLASIFLFPYNLKVWAYPPEVLGVRWVGDRVSVPDVERIRRNIAENRDDVSWGPNATFRFPKYGGTGAIWSALAARFEEDTIRYGERIEKIDSAARELHLAGGGRERYDTLITSMPLVVLVTLIDGAPPSVERAAKALVSSASHIVGIGLRGGMPETLARKCWMYFPEPNSPYYRVTVFSNYSPHNVPPGEGYWSLMAEVSESPVKPVNGESVVDDIVRALREDGLIGDAAQIVSRWHRREPFGYPTPSVGRDAALAEILPWLAAQRIFSRGRFGAWKYEVSNQDHSFMQGVELVDALTGNGDEVTLNDPDRANGGAFLRNSRPR